MTRNTTKFNPESFSLTSAHENHQNESTRRAFSSPPLTKTYLLAADPSRRQIPQHRHSLSPQADFLLATAPSRHRIPPTSSPLPLAAAPLCYPLSPPRFLSTWQRVAPFFILPYADMASTWLPRLISCCRGIHVAANSA